MQPGVGPEKPNQTQFSGQPQYINQQIQQSQGAFPQQQIIIINAKYQPSFNFRYLSYAVFGLGITAYFILSNMRTDGDIDQYLRFLSEATCCLSIILTFVFDAVFYKGKADWQSTTGQSNTGSITGMVFDILFAGLVIIFGFMWFIGD
ncbi:MAG: hypothetical protein CMB09_04190 [Euryarchaeota archaeon]|nr:hypothetical protein [Euryarchaeota archaeon]|tara:strand:+ start:899 stop:1342 length:444 start_codon:yes stop_codon:yes gene_type:complete